MPNRIASLFSIFRLSPGSLTTRSRRLVVLVACLLLVVASAVFVRTTWNAELSNDVITFTALFVITALVLIGFARGESDSE